MVESHQYTEFRAKLLDESARNPASRDGQEANFELSFSKRTSSVMIKIDPKLVEHCKSRIAEYLAKPHQSEDDLQECMTLRNRIEKEYKDGNANFDLATEIAGAVFDEDHRIDTIGGILTTLRSIVWPDEGASEDPMEYKISDDKKSREMLCLQEYLYDPKRPFNLCASTDDAYIAACMLVRAAEDARKEALGFDRNARLNR